MNVSLRCMAVTVWRFLAGLLSGRGYISGGKRLHLEASCWHAVTTAHQCLCWFAFGFCAPVWMGTIASTDKAQSRTTA